MPGELSFFEIGTGDTERAQAFYAELFGWEFKTVEGGTGGSVIDTGGVPGGIHGGDAGASPYVFFRVEEMDPAVAKVRQLGGTAEPVGDGADGDPELVERFGRFMLCTDDQGSSFGLHEPAAGR